MSMEEIKDIVAPEETAEAPAVDHDELIICRDAAGSNAVSISTNVIAQVIRKSVSDVEGVAHFAPKGLVDIISVFSSRAYDSSIDIAVRDNSVSITLALILYYGCQVKSVCQEVQKNVKEQIEALTSASVANVSIVVRDLVEPEATEEEDAAAENGEEL